MQKSKTTAVNLIIQASVKGQTHTSLVTSRPDLGLSQSAQSVWRTQRIR